MQLQPLFGIMVCSFLLVIGSVPALGQSFLQEAVLTLDRNPSKAQKPIKQILFKPPTDEEPPPTRGAGSRNDRLCSQDALVDQSSLSSQPLALTALVPPNQSNLTWAERPTVWVYVPETSARQIVLSVRDLDRLLEMGDRQNQPIELLILSACQTAKGDKRAVLGMAGVALRSGARSTIATLWSVQDDSTSELMTQFYIQLQKPGITRAEALRQAQLSLLRSSNYQHPYHWAPFVLIGNWR